MSISEKSRSDWLGRGILGPTEEDPDQAGTTTEERSSPVLSEEEADSGLSIHLHLL